MESTVVTNTRVTSAGFEQTSVSRVRMTPAMLASAPVGPIALADVRSVVEVREAERTELRQLNERFASCIEKVRFLEEENARIVEQLADLRQSGAEGTEQVRKDFADQLQTLRAELEESEVAKGELDVRLTILNNKTSSVQGLVEDAHLESASDRNQLEQLEHIIEERRVELQSLRTRVENFDVERSTDLEEIERLKTEVERLSTELEQEALAHVKVENERLTLREELEFRKEAFDTELKEITATAFRGSTAEVRDFWKAELADAILDVRFEYEKNIETAKIELESLFSIKSDTDFTVTDSSFSAFSAVGRVKEDNERLKTEVADLRKRVPSLEKRHAELEVDIAEVTREMDAFRSEAELERMSLDHELSEVRFELTSMLEELRTQMDTRLRLRIEIAAYRKLIEYEEARLFPEKKKELEEKRQKERERLPPKKRPVTVEVLHEDDELHDIVEETEDVDSEKADTVKEFEIDVGGKGVEHVTIEDSDGCEGTTDVAECLEATEVLDATDVTDTVECVDAVEVIDAAECVDDVEVIDAAECVEDVEVIDAAECVDAVEITDAAECVEDVEVIDATECVDAVEITDTDECVDAVEITDAAECVEAVEITDAAECVEDVEVTDAAECVDAVEITDAAECVEDVEVTDAAECVEAVEITDAAECVEDVEVTDAAECVEDVEVTDAAECVEDVEVTDAAECVEAEGAVGDEDSAITEKTSWTSEISEVVEGSASAEATVAAATEFAESWEQEFVAGFQARKTKSKKKFKGNVQIKEVSADGSYVVIQNKSSKKQDIGDWVLKRDHDSGRRVIDFAFPAGTVIEGNGTIKIWAKGSRPTASSEPECRFPTWGFGSAMAVCTLSSASGEEKANHTEKAT